MLKSDSHLLSTLERGITSLNWMTFKSLETFVPHSPMVTHHAFFLATNHIHVGLEDSNFVIYNLCENVVQLTIECHLNGRHYFDALVSASVNSPVMLDFLFASQLKVYFEWESISTLVENILSVVVIISGCEVGGVLRSHVIVLCTKQRSITNALNMFEKLPAEVVVALAYFSC